MPHWHGALDILFVSGAGALSCFVPGMPMRDYGKALNITFPVYV